MGKIGDWMVWLYPGHYTILQAWHLKNFAHGWQKCQPKASPFLSGAFKIAFSQRWQFLFCILPPKNICTYSPKKVAYVCSTVKSLTECQWLQIHPCFERKRKLCRIANPNAKKILGKSTYFYTSFRKNVHPFWCQVQTFLTLSVHKFTSKCKRFWKWEWVRWQYMIVSENLVLKTPQITKYEKMKK